MVIVVRPRTLWLDWTSASAGRVLSASMLTAQDSVLACIGATVRTVAASKVRRTIAASLAWFRRVIFQTVTTILSRAGYSSLSIPGEQSAQALQRMLQSWKESAASSYGPWPSRDALGTKR